MPQRIQKNQELPQVLLLVLAYVALGFASLRWYPLFIDEPAYVDPAASFVLGQGFSSGCWPNQGYGEFWAGNVPLYEFCLIPWFEIFGFGQVAARSINLAFVALGAVFFWSGIRRLAILRTTRMRLICLALVLLSQSGALWVNFGRPDSICVALAGICLFAFSIRNKTARRACIFLVTILFPFAALALSLVTGFSGFSLLARYRKRFLPEVLCLAAGGVTGTFGLLGLYQLHGVLDAFLLSITPHSKWLASFSENAAAFPVNMLKHRIGGFTDHTLLCLMAAFTCACLATSRVPAARPWKIIGILSLAGIPGLLIITGVFPIYYSWYSFVPALVALLALWERNPFQIPILKGAAVAALVMVAVSGLARVWINGFIYKDEDSVGRMDRYVRSMIRKEDVIITQQGWYTAKEIGSKVYFGMGVNPGKLNHVNVLIGDPQFCQSLSTAIGGHWMPPDDELITPNRNTHTLPFSSYYRENPKFRTLVFRKMTF